MPVQNVNLQDSFLNQVRKESVDVEIQLLSGATLTGQVRGFDNFTVIMRSEGMQHLVYKHGIAQIIAPKFSHATRTDKPDEAGRSHGHPENKEERPEAHFNSLDLSHIQLPSDKSAGDSANRRGKKKQVRAVGEPV